MFVGLNQSALICLLPLNLQVTRQRFDMYSCFIQVPQTAIKRLATLPIGLDDDDDEEEDREASAADAAAAAGADDEFQDPSCHRELSAEQLNRLASSKVTGPSSTTPDLKARFFSATNAGGDCNGGSDDDDDNNEEVDPVIANKGTAANPGKHPLDLSLTPSC